jgi:hypothetical protein
VDRISKELSANTKLSHYRIITKIGAGERRKVYVDPGAATLMMYVPRIRPEAMVLRG